ncbi:hypothetical protein E2562_030723 [Oryza meyeriana var. granulata]|uniref:Uncharacterized protein n=1 Tax=Oryza meyeriana var. granulata TaxID=110450 RepID=A0A6G1E4F5_9ORYZ|nr:hypothetical protein E2562_030723 [Oryza meyeriana var. granulata]
MAAVMLEEWPKEFERQGGRGVRRRRKTVTGGETGIGARFAERRTHNLPRVLSTVFLMVESEVSVEGLTDVRE